MKEQEKIKILLQMGVGRTSLGNYEESKIISKALEKQIPKEPIDKIMYKQCPICGAVDLGKYCMECGQAIKWE